MKIDDIPDENIKKTLKDQKTKEEALLLAHEKDLKSIETPAITFFDKVKNGANKAWEKVVEYKKPILIATGI